MEKIIRKKKKSEQEQRTTNDEQKQEQEQRTTSNMQTDTELAMSVVLENEQAFKWFTKEQYKNMLLTCKSAVTSRSVLALQSKYYALKLYRDLYVMVYRVGTAVHYRRTPMQKILSIRMQKECDVMIKNVANICQKNAAVNDCMSMLIMADYKTSLCDEMFGDNQSEFKNFMRSLCENVFIKELGICDVQKHVHDPHHYVFDGYKYEFYETIEKQGKSVLVMYQKWCNGEEMSDFEYDDDEDDEDIEEEDDYDY